MIIYGYIVREQGSCDAQDIDAIKSEMETVALSGGFGAVQSWIVEQNLKGRSKVNKTLREKVKNMHKGDVLICNSLIDLGRNTLSVMDILSSCYQNGVLVYCIKQDYILGAGVCKHNRDMTGFLYQLPNEIEKRYISKRSYEVAERKRREGVTLGRPKGCKATRTKLTGKEIEIEKMLKEGHTVKSVAQTLGVHRFTVSNFMKINGWTKTSLRK